jgi:hypothetical protein
VAPNEVVDFLLVLSMQILELVERSEFYHIQAIRCESVRFAFEQIFRLQAGDLTKMENFCNKK